jgi:hypothetical protein
MGWLMRPTTDRRIAAAGNYALQLVGSLVLLAADGTDAALLLLGIVLFGLGLGNATSLPPLIAQADFAPADTARAVALVTACSRRPTPSRRPPSGCCAAWIWRRCS